MRRKLSLLVRTICNGEIIRLLPFSFSSSSSFSSAVALCFANHPQQRVRGDKRSNIRALTFQLLFPSVSFSSSIFATSSNCKAALSRYFLPFFLSADDRRRPIAPFDDDSISLFEMAQQLWATKMKSMGMESLHSLKEDLSFLNDAEIKSIWGQPDSPGQVQVYYFPREITNAVESDRVGAESAYGSLHRDAS